MSLVFFLSFLFSISSFATEKPPQLTGDIPPDVIQRFHDSFIYDNNGKFRGAYIGEIAEYATTEEIVTIVTGTVSGVVGGNVFVGWKPVTSGCKRNSKYICRLEGDVIDIDTVD